MGNNNYKKASALKNDLKNLKYGLNKTM